MDSLIEPHCGVLKPLLANSENLPALTEQAEMLKSIILDSMEVSDLMMLSNGSFSPLEGFMTRKDYAGVISEMRLDNGSLWPIPITLAVSEKVVSSINFGEDLTLKDESGNILAIMRVEDIFEPDIIKEARNVFQTSDSSHPGVARLFSLEPYRLGGSVQVISEGDWRKRFPEYATPYETRQIFLDKGWKSITAFQTRNPLHRSHEYLSKTALEMSDGLLIHPIVGRLKPGDIPAEIRMDCYHAMLDNYYPSNRVLLKVYPMEMRYAGPREAVLHAIIRQNFGCSHIIIGRDHAGVGGFYGTFDSQNIFDQLSPEDLQIEPIKFEHVFWCKSCGGMASVKTCPHPKKDQLIISGTKLREMFAEGIAPPKEIVRPEVSEILVDYYKGLESM